MIPYRWTVRLLARRRANIAWRYWRAWRGERVGDYAALPALLRRLAPGRTVVDIGCMWGVNGAYAFAAEEAGAARVRAVDVFGPTPEFEAAHRARGSRVEFILGDATDPAVLERVGPTDVVFCAGVLYHLPSPFDLLVALRRLCRETLILRTASIPEVPGVPNAAVYYPMLPPRARRTWDLRHLGVPRQVGITDGFEPDQGYGNFFWGLSPSCLVSLLQTAGFRVDERFPEAFAQTVICTPVEPPFAHRLPAEDEARAMGARISAAGVARPA